MELIEDVLKSLNSQLPENVSWINSDTCKDNDIGSQILHIRMGDGKIDTSSIILYGFKSFEDLVRSEKRYPSLLVSSGVFYLRLPSPLPTIRRILKKALSFSSDHQSLKAELVDSALAGSRLEKIESVLAHNMGNFLGSEKLLYGAHLAGKISVDVFKTTLESIRKEQEKILGKSQEYLLYRLSQVDYESSSNDDGAGAGGADRQDVGHESGQELSKKPATSDQSEAVTNRADSKEVQGNILYIDDHAHLGWARAVASSLWGKCGLLDNIAEPTDSSENVAELDGFRNQESELFAMRSGKFSANEDAFLNKALEIVGNDKIIEKVDLILLDLRLRWKKDEDSIFDELSGIQLLNKIRQANAAIPVIILTASRKAQNMEMVLNKGADAYFIKEIPQAEEDVKYIKKYYERFVDTVQKAMKNAYLGVAWRLVKNLEKPVNWNNHIEINYEYKDEKKYEKLPKELRINWEEHVIRPLKKGIGLIRKHYSEFEKNIFQISTIEEAIINFKLPNDTINELNGEYKSYFKSEKNLYRNPMPYLANGHQLLSNLRNFAAHGIHNRSLLNEDDGKFAMYLAFRNLIGKNSEKRSFKNPAMVEQLKKSNFIPAKQIHEILRDLANKMFPDHSKTKITKDDIRNFLNELKRTNNQNINAKDKCYINFLKTLTWDKKVAPFGGDFVIISKICEKLGYNKQTSEIL